MKAFTRLNATSASALLASTILLSSGAVSAQQNESNKSNLLFEEIMVTASKKSVLQDAQDVSTAVTAYGERQLDLLNFNSLQSLSFKMPNVSLDGIGTAKGVANFTIRGMGVNSSIPSIEPTVGVFVDGMYYGLNMGVLFDQFDLESVEVLRGPQGLLFGRNVTGGALLLNTSKPSFDTRVRAKASYESGNNLTLQGVVSGPIIADKLAAKLAVHYNHETGYFTVPSLEDTSHGDSETLVVRGAVTFKPTDSAELTVRYEHGETEGDGPAVQNRAFHDRKTFDMDFDFEGYEDSKWDQITAQLDLDVALGDGTITNIAGWRKYDQAYGTDIDSTPIAGFHVNAVNGNKQFSNELRYNGTFGNLELTTGLFYYTNEIYYIEHRIFAGGASLRTGGGDTDQTTMAAFASVDYNVSDKLKLTFGLRYTDEDKEALVATIDTDPSHGCNIVTGDCVYDFPFQGATEPADIKSSNWTPKIGFTWRTNDDMQIYGHYTQGHRSGGINLRHTVTTAPAEPYTPEKQHAFELGLKADNADKTVRLNAAVFYNSFSNLQRETNDPHPVAGVVQRILNTADARVMGAEVELTAELMPGLTFTGSLGLLDDKYTEVLSDLNGDGSINGGDLDLHLPRLAPVTYGGGLIYNTDVDNVGTLTANVFFNHRDFAWYNDANTAPLYAVNMLDASISLGLMEDAVQVTFYGKNLLDEVQAGGTTNLPNVPAIGLSGGTFAPLKKGRVFGASIKYSF